MASAAVADSFVSSDDRRKNKQLQEARAAGTAAPETDDATGKIINPHNPEFITKAPWYLNQNKPSLKHHQAWNLKAPGAKDWYKRGTKGDVKTKFIKGACENCGATTHTKKDCVERPRQVGAKFNGQNLMPDEYINTLDLDWDGKRDRWNGFQPDDYQAVIDEWERVEGERRRVKAAEMEERAKVRERLKAQKRALKKKRKQRRKQLRRQAEGRDSCTDSDTDTANDSDTDTDTDSDSDLSDDEDLGEKMKDFDKTSAATAMKDDRLRTTTRNLRIREDTAKYLLNLDVNSAFYDPKSRSMRANPLAHLKEEEQGTFRGDNYVRASGDAKQLTELMVFAWDAYKHGEKIHDTAQPTQALKMWEIYKQRSKNLKEEQKKELVEKYGGQEHMEAPRELLFSQNDNYVEYARDGRVIKGRERAYVQSKYQEDILPGNHSSVWGSWFCPNTQKWGFKCCQQTHKNAYCVPIKRAAADVEPVEAGVEIPGGGQAEAIGQAEEVSSDSDASSSSAEGGADDSAAAKEAKAKAADEKRKARALKGLQLYGKKGDQGSAAASSSSGAAVAAESAEAAEPASKLSTGRTSAFGHDVEEITDLDAKKVKEAVQREKKRRKLDRDQPTGLDAERQRGYNSLAGDQIAEVSPEELEAYRLTRSRADDPMAQFT